MTPLLWMLLGAIFALFCAWVGGRIVMVVFEATGVIPDATPYPHIDDDVDREFRELEVK